MRVQMPPLSTVAVALGAVVVGLVVGNVLGVRKGFDVREWQTTMGVAVAIVAAGIAWVNVRTTLRVNLISREEDRMERTLPGLNEPVTLLAPLVGALRELKHKEFAITIINSALPGFGSETAKLSEAVENQLPSTDGPTRHRVTESLKVLIRKSAELSAAWKEFERATSDLRDIGQFATNSREAVNASVEDAKSLVQERLVGVEDAVRSIERLHRELQGRIEMYERRLPIFRKRIEDFFGD
jgi:hypothetical protein